MNAKWLLPAVALWLTSCGVRPPDGQKSPETCGNELDDDGNGLVDCADPVCSANTECEPAPECAKQTDCFLNDDDYFDFISLPVPRCDNAKKCVTEGVSIDINVQLRKGNGYAGTGWETNGISVRFIKKVAVDGSAVTCDIINNIATGNAPADADVLERSGRFNYMAMNTYSANNTVGKTDIPLGYSVTTGSDFLVFAELWTAKLDSLTHYPTGKRVEHRCYDNPNDALTGALLQPITEADSVGEVTERAFNIPMPGPQNP